MCGEDGENLTLIPLKVVRSHKITDDVVGMFCISNVSQPNGLPERLLGNVPVKNGGNEFIPNCLSQ